MSKFKVGDVVNIKGTPRHEKIIGMQDNPGCNNIIYFLKTGNKNCDFEAYAECYLEAYAECYLQLLEEELHPQNPRGYRCENNEPKFKIGDFVTHADDEFSIGKIVAIEGILQHIYEVLIGKGVIHYRENNLQKLNIKIEE